MWSLIVQKTGCKSIEEAMEIISPEEFLIWQQIYQESPWGYEIENLRADVLNNLVAAFGGSKETITIDNLREEALDPEGYKANKMVEMIKQMAGVK